jgi:hypothetical protein
MNIFIPTTTLDTLVETFLVWPSLAEGSLSTTHMAISIFNAALAAAALKVLYAFSISEKAISVAELSGIQRGRGRILTMGDQFTCWDAACLKQTQEHRSCDGVDKSRRNAQVHHPQFLDFEVTTFTVYANVGDGTSNSNEILGHLQCRRNTACFNHCISTCVVCQSHQGFDGIGLVRVDSVVCAKLFCNFQSIVIFIDGDDGTGTV